MKTCVDCNTLKPLSEFYKDIKKNWIYNRCKKCFLDKYSPNRGKPNLGRFKKGSIPPLRKQIDGRLSLRANQWRNDIINRDGKCVYCNSKKKLHAHHIKNWNKYPRLRFELNNGLTLCSSCHAKLHGKELCNILKNGTSWSKGKKFSKEYRKKLSDANKGTKPVTSFIKGHTPWNKGLKGFMKGRIVSLETRKKLSERRKGIKYSPETIKKMSAAKKGSVSPMKGKKHTIESLEKMSKTRKGQIPWNRGKKTGISTITSFIKGHTPWNKGLVGFMKGRIVSEETRKKQSESVKNSYLIKKNFNGRY